MTGAWLLLALAVVLVAANGVFVAAETALVTSDRTVVETGAAGGDRRLRMVATAMRALSTQLSGAQLGITVTSLAVGLVAEPSAATLLRAPLRSLGVSADLAETLSVALALLAATGVQMVLGELVPKNLALARPERTAAAVIVPQLAFSRLAKPVIAVLNGTANRLLRVVGVTPVEELRAARTPDELAFVMRRAADTGSLSPATAALLERSLTFGSRDAADVMTPRYRVRAVAADAPLSDLLAATRDTGHSRFPVIDGGLDDVVGLVHVKQAVAVPYDQRLTTPVARVMTESVLVPTTMSLDPLLDLLQTRGLQMAVVVDEYGGTAGLVTFEDLVEELVGDVRDEHDPGTARVALQPDGSWLVAGVLRPDEVRAETGLDLTDAAHVAHGGAEGGDGARAHDPPRGHRLDYTTVAGLVLALLRRLPEQGDTVDLPGLQLSVERLAGHRIDVVRLTLTVDPDQRAETHNTDSTDSTENNDGDSGGGK